jgi:hypothetical protein
MGVVFVGKYCKKCEDVFDKSSHDCFEQEEFKMSHVVSVPFKPQWFHAVGQYCSTKTNFRKI